MQRDRAVHKRNCPLRLVYVVTEDWFFVTHFLPMARAAQRAGFEIVVVTRVGDRAKEIESEGFRLVALAADRSAFGIGPLLSTLFRLRAIFLRERPDIIHAIALKSIILGGIANLLSGGSAGVFSLTGLGYLWSGNRSVLRVSRAAVRSILRVLGLRSPITFTFENDDDSHEFPHLNDKIVIGGWGVDAIPLSPKSMHSASPVRALYLGRMLKSKGIEPTVKAVQLAREKVDVQLELWGTPDPGNLTSLTEDQLLAFSKLEGVRWCGRAADVSTTWQRADIAILLSEREGMPRSLIEAAATGLPMIAFDVAGCRSIVQDGINGFLVPPGDVRAVADAILKLANDAELRARMGAAARSDFEQRFSIESVVPRIIEVYFNLVRYPQMR
ncbi:glucosyll transferase, group 1 [Rhizobium freirei PRF 81]|uniref:Glucosyll transferase, group 1 n=1 Tax=Rhizobium freirei PRF 81 TaxID=363754 RepID=N6UZC3_9HYPH|nr:glycosyltransferase family 4 protein [Rhizobium freirei]ENN84217.1 glucosyll transferase, group 1 [Rhizobium freirei PRF 81]